MRGKYLVVDKAILPSYCEKVIDAGLLLEDGTAKDVSEAVKMVGISRSTYYKYRDFVREISPVVHHKHAIVSMMMRHEVGVLSDVLNLISRYSFSIWTINQNPPVDGKANVVITLDLGSRPRDLDMMIEEIGEIKGLSRVQLLGID